jgi:hypothetical protein
LDEFHLAVFGSQEYDDSLSLRTALNRVFDSIPTDVVLVVVCCGEDGATSIAGDWAIRMHQEGMPVLLEARVTLAGVVDFGLAALRPEGESTKAKGYLTWMFQHGVQFEIVVQGNARGLPEDLISGSTET